MTNLRLGMLLVIALSAGTAQATAQRTFVATYGSDTNSCSLALPCRAFAAAIAQTSPGGEVIVLNSGGYGPVTITQSVSIISPPGVYAGISVTSTPGNGVTIAAGASDIVILRGLTLTGPGVPYGESGNDGIDVQSAGVVHVEGVIVTAFRSNGLSVFTAGELYVSDSIFRGNFGGVFAGAPAAALKVSIIRSAVENSALEGLVVGSNASATIRESLFAGNGSRGLRAYASSGTPSEVVVESCVFSGNGEGILSGQTTNDASTIRVSNSTISHNSTGLRFINGNRLLSGGANTVEGNTTDGAFSGSYTKK